MTLSLSKELFGKHNRGNTCKTVEGLTPNDGSTSTSWCSTEDFVTLIKSEEDISIFIAAQRSLENSKS
jgi:hypothetical protein